MYNGAIIRFILAGLACLYLGFWDWWNGGFYG
jgi:hypothetical protein